MAIVREAMAKKLAQKVYQEMGAPPQVLFKHVKKYCQDNSIVVQVDPHLDKDEPVVTKMGRGYLLKIPANIYRTYYAVLGLAYILLGYTTGFLRLKFMRDRSIAEREANVFARELLLIQSNALAELYFEEEDEEMFKEYARIAGILPDWAIYELGSELRLFHELARQHRFWGCGYKSEKISQSTTHD